MRIRGCDPLMLWVCSSCLVTGAPARQTPIAPDPRNFASGRLIPDENYCDQPRLVVTRDGTWVCLMTTGAGSEGGEGQHIAATRSTDKGNSWSALVDVEPAGEAKSSYALALLTPGDRIYGFYCYNGDRIRTLPNGDPIRDDIQGWFCYRYSDDQGRSWSSRYRLPMRLTAADRSNDWQGRLQMFWAVGTPSTSGQSAMFGFTKLGRYLLQEGEGWFFRSDNILAEPDPNLLRWDLLPEGDHGLRAPELGSIQEEHDLVHLDGDDLFCVFRTGLGFAAGAYSRDGGRTWEKPEPLRYEPGGRHIKQPRACAKIWRTRAGRYLLWLHNNGTTTYNNGPNAGSRNLAWLSAGTLRHGRLCWSEPEIVAYVEGGLEGCSYPDLIEDDGRFYICATQKTEARVLEVESGLLDGLWAQGTLCAIASNGLVLDLDASALAQTNTTRPLRLPPIGGLVRGRTLSRQGQGGFSIETVIRFTRFLPDQVILDTRTPGGKGFALETTARRALRLELSDGWRGAFWESDSGSIQTAFDQHVVVIVDGRPGVMTFIVNGQLCDGGKERPFGFGRFDTAIKDINGLPTLRLTSMPQAKLLRVRVYNRALRTSEAVANWRAFLSEGPTPMRAFP